MTDIADRTTLGSSKRIDDKKKIMGTLSDTSDDQRQKCLPQQLEEQKISNKESELPNRRAEESYKSTEKLEERIEESDVRVAELDRMAEESGRKAEELDKGTEELAKRADELVKRAVESDRRAEESDRRAEELARRAEESDRRAEELAKRAKESDRKAEESDRGAEESDRRAEELAKRVEESDRRAEELAKRAKESDRKAEESDRRAEESDRRAEELAKRAKESDKKAEESDRGAEESDRRAEELARRVEESDRRVEELAKRAKVSDRRTDESDRRAEELAKRAEESDRRTEELERQLNEVQEQVLQAQRSLTETRQRLREREDRLQAYDTQWVVRREEIELTGPELGRGAWATVSVAKFRGAQVAVKIIHNQLVSRHNIHLFRREMNMAAKLRHPNLVQFIGATVEGDMMIVMEFMVTSLRRQLQSEEYFQPKFVKSISLDVARALSYLHQMKPDPIVHRDISSANVLLEPLLPPNQWRAKVTDYGSVNLVRQLNTENPGGPAYAAPEANNPRLQSPKMDIYSFGALVLEMLTGHLPSPEDRPELLCQVHHEQLLRLIRRCLSERIEDRPNASIIISELS